MGQNGGGGKENEKVMEMKKPMGYDGTSGFGSKSAPSGRVGAGRRGRKKGVKKEEPEATTSSNSDVLGLFHSETDLGNLGEGEKWVCLKTVVDSGAADTVAPSDTLSWIKLGPSEGSQRGQTWQVVGGKVLPNYGEKEVCGVTEEGGPIEAVYQIADVAKALGSLSRTSDQGNRVVFEADGGYIENLNSGKCTAFTREENVFVHRTWVKKLGKEGFQRQGK